jgi:UvrD/REP helicase N-terminal domain/UvrD-like helicase C-terminal domain
MSDPADKYALSKADRQKYIDAILQSKSSKKIVVAGPGTGKTFLFKEILKDKKNSLTLTFVNSLVEDLSLELCGISDVKTLHGFGRSIMAKATGNARIFPKLPTVIKEDAAILLGEDIDFDSLFQKMIDESGHIDFYKERKTFYAHYGFNDVIFAAVKYLDQNPSCVPKFDQVVINEFQDFNLLEVTLIELLAAKNPILIAGDDDQSLYYFKHASPSHIRERHSNGDPYEAFNLPYWSRCTRVIVEAINDVIKAAIAKGFLKGRIDKPYLYFEDERKEAECKKYPKLVHVQCYAGQIPFFIDKAIAEIAEERREKFSALIIAPTKARCRAIARGLRNKGFANIPYVDQETATDPSILDGLLLLTEDVKCNLGWRIAAKFYLAEEEFKKLLDETADTTKNIYDLLSDDLKTRVKGLLSTFKKVGKEQAIGDTDSDGLLRELSLDPHAIAQAKLREIIKGSVVTPSNPATRNIPIKITTIPSSKGLAENYVFIVDFDDRFFLEKGGICSDQKIYDFLVALTRARKKVFLISCAGGSPTFLSWIEKGRVDTVGV